LTRWSSCRRNFRCSRSSYFSCWWNLVRRCRLRFGFCSWLRFFCDRLNLCRTAANRVIINCSNNFLVIRAGRSRKNNTSLSLTNISRHDCLSRSSQSLTLPENNNCYYGKYSKDKDCDQYNNAPLIARCGEFWSSFRAHCFTFHVYILTEIVVNIKP